MWVIVIAVVIVAVVCAARALDLWVD